MLEPLAKAGKFSMPVIPEYATCNGHMFYLVCNNIDERTALISRLKEESIGAVFHYLSLHSSDYYRDKHDGRSLPNCDHFADCLVRMPMFYELTLDEVRFVCKTISDFYNV